MNVRPHCSVWVHSFVGSHDLMSAEDKKKWRISNIKSNLKNTGQARQSRSIKKYVKLLKVVFFCLWNAIET